MGTLATDLEAQISDLSAQKVVMSETPAQKEARLKWWRDVRAGARRALSRRLYRAYWNAWRALAF